MINAFKKNKLRLFSLSMAMALFVASGCTRSLSGSGKNDPAVCGEIAARSTGETSVAIMAEKVYEEIYVVFTGLASRAHTQITRYGIFEEGSFNDPHPNQNSFFVYYCVGPSSKSPSYYRFIHSTPISDPEDRMRTRTEDTSLLSNPQNRVIDFDAWINSGVTWAQFEAKIKEIAKYKTIWMVNRNHINGTRMMIVEAEYNPYDAPADVYIIE